MPSGRTHDRITLWSLPLVAGLTFERTHNSMMTLLVAGGFLFSGLMFGPDLDIYSKQYRRWGPFRWIWLPYRRSMQHRSVLSHGLVIGTVLRILYLLSWLAVLWSVAILLGAIALHSVGQLSDWQFFVEQMFKASIGAVVQSVQQHFAEWISLGMGLELGALSHSVSDWLVSTYKRGLNHNKAATPRKKSTRK